MFLHWRHLKLLKWAGRAHDSTGPEGTKPRELALCCPSCPYLGINLLQIWREATARQVCFPLPHISILKILMHSFLYMMFVCMDVNFLKNQLVSNYSQDPGLGTRFAYMVPREPYQQYVFSRCDDSDVSNTLNFGKLSKDEL
jgi:hypothetical protein